MYDYDDGNVISWYFFEELVKFQDENGLHAGNKLRREHINWQDNKMNIRIAAQTLSRSVSVTMIYLKDDLNFPQFANASETAKFCEIINDAFDILNSRELYHKDEYKIGLSDSNIKQIYDRINTIISYVNNLKYLNGSLIVHSRKKIGLIYSLQNIINI